MIRWFSIAAVLVGCGKSASDDSSPGTPTETTPTVDGCVATLPDAEVIAVTTRDGVDLEADRYAGIAGRPGVVLLHMIPPSNTRADYPNNFIKKLTCHGWSVVNLDRRGAGGSEGTPADSYTGPGGAFDAEAAVAALTEVGAEGVGIVGASNGTTSALDYAVLAKAEGLPEVSAIAMMTGGGYTEAQNALGDLPNGVALALLFGSSEAAWSDSKQAGARPIWEFLEYDGGGHGTQLFGTTPSVRADMEDFFLRTLPNQSR